MANRVVLDIEVRETASGYEAVAAGDGFETSGNPYVAVLNLIDSMTDDDVMLDVSFGGHQGDSRS